MRKNLTNLPPLKSLGQNFLCRSEIVEKILEVARLEKSDVVLEIGPGHGELTLLLAKRVSRIIAVEIDRGLAKRLAQIVPGNVCVRHADARRLDFSKLNLEAGRYIVVANLPFNAGTVIIRRLIESAIPPARLVVILQAEVIDRILANDHKASVLSLAVKFYGRARKLFTIPAGAYKPVPRVQTALLEIVINEKNDDYPSAEAFFEVIKPGFSARRKYLANNLSRQGGFSSQQVDKAFRKIGLSPQVRAEDVVFTDWLKLADILSSNCGKHQL